MTFISTVFENVYMVKMVRVLGSGLTSGRAWVRGHDKVRVAYHLLKIGALWTFQGQGQGQGLVHFAHPS